MTKRKWSRDLGFPLRSRVSEIDEIDESSGENGGNSWGPWKMGVTVNVWEMVKNEVLLYIRKNKGGLNG